MVPSLTDVVYTSHLLLVFLERKFFDSLGTGHDAACAVRGRAIPFGIAFANGQDASVTHVDGNENLFAFMCGDGSFSENHLIDIDVVVNGMKRFAGLKAGSFQQFLAICSRFSLANCWQRATSRRYCLRYFRRQSKDLPVAFLCVVLTSPAGWPSGFLFAVLLPCILL